uniref:ribosomal protein L14 n=1 Tax=Microzonia abyssicola TaxID=217214 RepID=UPI002E77AD9D|nr:ribosomal protein L14 [Syringoderma abyssicola]WBP70367.1 ribosomal protein L14 [Syringoderma abyssicola]
MIRAQTILKVVDNSGGKTAKCIKVKGKSGKAAAHLGDIVIVSIQSLRKRYRSQVRVRVNKSEVHHGVIVQTRRFHRHLDGRAIYFGSNSVVIITPKSKVLGTRISTFIPRGLRGLKWAKLGTLAKGFI